MKTLFNRRVLGGRIARAAALCLLALAAIHFHPREARAQWSSPDAGGNINSTNTGNVVIGTTAPTNRGKLEITSDKGVAAGEHGLIYASRGGVGSGGFFMGYRANGTAATGGFLRGTSNLPLFIGTAASPEAVTITDAGRVGVGTSAPTAAEPYSRFTVQGSDPTAIAQGVIQTGVGQAGFIYNRTGGTPTRWYQYLPPDSADFRIYFGGPGITGSGDKFTVQSVTGNVGIGTTSPSQALHVRGRGLLQNTGTASAFIMDRTDGKIASFGAGGSSATFAYDDTGVFKIESNTRANITAGTFGTGATTRLVVDGAGKVGIGIEAPVSALHVVGDVTVTGNITAKYQDLAEWVPSKQKLSAGTVVVLDTAHDNHVLASSTAYDTRVAGVISAQPGIALGEAGEGKTLVATTGRVKVKVDATRAPIRIGDLIVTGDQPGVAMRSEPVSVAGVSMHRPGTIIGKALEALDKGTGEILVLLSLQ